MPRASVHATRDVPVLRGLLETLGTGEPPRLEEMVRDRHRAIDKNTDLADTDLHFMRGSDEEPIAKALREALDHVRDRAWHAAEALAAAHDEAKAGEMTEAHRGAAVLAFVDAAHAVRDSYSTGHATRAPGPGGPRVVNLRSWGVQREARQAFGLGHALKHDLRFERPFRAGSPEVHASDLAVEGLGHLVASVARRPSAEREKAFEAAWMEFARQHFRE